MTNPVITTPRERLHGYLSPIYAALGNVLSTTTGRALMFAAADVLRKEDDLRLEYARTKRPHATRSQEYAAGDLSSANGAYCGYMDALTLLVMEACNKDVCMSNVHRVIYTEIYMYNRDSNITSYTQTATGVFSPYYHISDVANMYCSEV